MEAIKFSNKGQNWEVVEIKEHSSIFSSQLGWTHFAGIKRPNGKKVYYANLLIIDGEVVDTTVVL
jgi:hypothetical protein